MSGGVCSQFVLHAWKTDVCASCLRPRLKHADRTDFSVSSSQSEQVHSTSSPTAQSMHVGTQLSESAHSSNVGAAKPSPAKVKPTVSTKPAMPKKPNLTRDQVSVKSDIKQSDEHISGEHLMQSKSEGSVPQNSSAVRFTEEELINSFDGVSKEMCTTNEDEVPVQSNEKAFHHYDLYDVTARESSETTKQPEAVVETACEDKCVSRNLDVELEHRKFQTLPVSAMRVDEVAEEHVAMPYNVVDITMRRPHVSNIDSLVSDTTSAGSNSPSIGVNTWPSKPQPTKRQMIPRSPPKPQERLSKHKEQAATSLNMEVSSREVADGCTKAPAIASKVLPSELVSERYAHRIYEEIDDLNVEQSFTVADTELSRQTTARFSVGKSPAFEAKMAALASLDLGKTVKQVSTVAPDVSLPEEMPAVKATVASSVQDTVVVPAAKPEKTRKSGGKTFFQKLLKFGSKEASEAAQSSTVNGTDDNSLDVLQCPDSPSSGVTNVPADAVSSFSAVPTQTVQLTEKQAMLMNLKDCLAKRQTSIGNESSEVARFYSRTQSSERTPLQSSTQSTSSVQPMPRCDSNVEKTEKQTVVRPIPVPESCPVAVSQASGPSIHEQPSSKDGLISAPQPTGKESDVDKGQQSVDKKGNRLQQLEVRDLTVVTEDAGNVDSSMSTCSSDAVSPTPSDLSVESTDHPSLKRKSRTDRPGICCIMM